MFGKPGQTMQLGQKGDSKTMSEEKQKEEMTAFEDGREITDDELAGVAGGRNETWVINGRCSYCGTTVEKQDSGFYYCPKCKKAVRELPFF